MDCDKFDHILMELLYDELDELTKASAQRHADQCQRCRETLAGFKATREASTLRLVEVPDGFEARIMDAEARIRRRLPVRARVSRTLTILSGYAMRPQLAMAALLLLVIGTSLALLRPTPGSHGSVHVTERGVPQAENELVVAVKDEPPPAVENSRPAPASELAQDSEPVKQTAKLEQAKPVTAAESLPYVPAEESDDRARAEAEDRAYAAAMEAYRGGNHEAAQEQFDAIVQSGSRNSAAAELYAAFAAEKTAGCSAALPRFDSVAAKNESNDLGHQATWQSATCRSRIGQVARARLDLQKLSHVPAYAQRAQQALLNLGEEGESSLLATRRAEKKADQSTAGAEAPAAKSKSVGAGAPAVAPKTSAPGKPKASKSEAVETRKTRPYPKSKPAAKKKHSAPNANESK